MSVSQEIEYDIQRFNYEIASWIFNSHFYRELFQCPESIHVSVPEGPNYTALQHELAEQAEFMTVHQDKKGRFITIAEVAIAYALPGLGKVKWIEAREAKPRITKPTVEAVGFYVDDLEKARTVFEAKKVHTEHLEHLESAFSVKVRGSSGRAIFSDIGLGYEAKENAENHLVRQVKL